ncbi:MAG: 2-methylcitrate dehydratase PrpD [Gammaproteobacteria bacterium]|jgi:2-methylcitrate dehydratase PrpD
MSRDVTPLSSICLVEQLADFVFNLTLDNIPSEVLDEASRCVLDTVGVILSGQSTDVAQKIREYAAKTYQSGHSRLLGFDQSLIPTGAALVNATAGHSQDFDDTSYTGIMHRSVVVLPAALAIAEQYEFDGAALLVAFIAGVEIEYAIAEFCTTHNYFEGWWTTGLYGSLGAAATSAKLLGLDREGIAHSIALGLSYTQGVKAVFGTDAKPLGCGMAASRGVEAALLAANGMTGPLDIFENGNGFLKLYNQGQQQSQFIGEWFERWRLLNPGILFKSYPVCSAAQAGAEAVLNLINTNNLGPDDVISVLVDVPPLVRISLVYDNPQSLREAQFSMPFAVGCMLAFEQLKLEQLQAPTLSDGRLQTAMQKVTTRVPDWLASDASVLERCPEGAGVTIATRQGQLYEEFLDRPTGMPGNPVSTDRLISKFTECAAFAGMELNIALELAANLLQIRNCRDVSRLTKSCFVQTRH